eukprot:scaffold14529_cov60-Phaeocystis_antarctica.AAC.6
MTGLALAGGTTARRKNHGIAVCLTQTGNTGHPRARVATVRGGGYGALAGRGRTARATPSAGARLSLAGARPGRAAAMAAGHRRAPLPSAKRGVAAPSALSAPRGRATGGGALSRLCTLGFSWLRQNG